MPLLPGYKWKVNLVFGLLCSCVGPPAENGSGWWSHIKSKLSCCVTGPWSHSGQGSYPAASLIRLPLKILFRRIGYEWAEGWWSSLGTAGYSLSPPHLVTSGYGDPRHHPTDAGPALGMPVPSWGTLHPGALPSLSESSLVSQPRIHSPVKFRTSWAFGIEILEERGC